MCTKHIAPNWQPLFKSALILFYLVIIHYNNVPHTYIQYRSNCKMAIIFSHLRFRVWLVGQNVWNPLGSVKIEEISLRAKNVRANVRQT